MQNPIPPQTLPGLQEQYNELKKMPVASPKGRFLIGLVGFIFMAIGIYFISTTLIFMSSAIETTGTITGNKITTGVSNHQITRSYCPQAEFIVDGRQYFSTNNICSNFSYSVGSQVQILYNPRAPENARIKAPSQWLLPIVFTIIGGIAFFAAIFNKIRMG